MPRTHAQQPTPHNSQRHNGTPAHLQVAGHVFARQPRHVHEVQDALGHRLVHAQLVHRVHKLRWERKNVGVQMLVLSKASGTQPSWFTASTNCGGNQENELNGVLSTEGAIKVHYSHRLQLTLCGCLLTPCLAKISPTHLLLHLHAPHRTVHSPLPA